MKSIPGCLAMLLVLSFSAAVAGAQTQRPSVPPLQDLAHLFDYDSSASLDVEETMVLNFNGVQVHEITYASPKGGRVPAYLVVPPDRGPFAGIVFHHWGLGDRAEFLPEALMLAQAGAVSLLIDAPFVRPAPWTRPADDPEHAQATLDTKIQDVIDSRRAVDLLAGRVDVDPKRLAYVGHSVGADLGGILAGIEKRLKTYVLMAGSASATRDILLTPNPQTQLALQSAPKETIQKFIQALAPLDAEHYIGHAAPAFLFFQFARFDLYETEELGLDYYRDASEPKLAAWYNTGHELNDLGALRDRDEWLQQQLGLAPVAPLLHQGLAAEGAVHLRNLP